MTVTGRFLLVVAFAAEVLLGIGVVVAGGSLIDGRGGLALGGAMGVAWIGLWARWCAPRSPHRLTDPALLVVQWILFLVGALALIAAGHVRFGVIVAVSSLHLLALRRWAPEHVGRTEPTTA